MNEQRTERIRRLLQDSLRPEVVEIIDQSHLHAGHAGARDGRGHFDVTVVSQAFAGQRMIERHRLVYAALGEMMDTDVHALSIHARTPEEAG